MLMKQLLAAGAALMASLAYAAAEITTAQVDRLIAAKGLTVLDREPDTIIVRAPTGDQVAIGLIDELGDGRRSILAFLGIYQNSNRLPPAAFNTWNSLATYKGFLMEGNAGVMQINIAIGTLEDATIAAAWDMFLAETLVFRSFLYGGPSIQNSASLIGAGASGREIHDAGLTRTEVTARDAALTAALNKAPTEAASEVLNGMRLTDTQKRLLQSDSPLGVNTETREQE
ncbi:MAG: hypothetical protein AAGH41_13965 [Pseudomonadota bacterium]